MMELKLYDNCQLSAQDKTDIDSLIDLRISEHKQNSQIINFWTMEAVSLSRAVTAKSSELEQQGWLESKWKNFTGENQKLSARNSNDLAKAQYLSQQTLVKLADQNLITLEMAIALGDKLNYLANDVAKVKNEILILYRFFSDFQSQVQKQNAEFKRNDDLLFWINIIEDDQVLGEKTYSQLSIPERIICLASNFFIISKQTWNYRDLAFLKSVMKKIEIPVEAKIKPLDLIEICNSNPEICKKLLSADDALIPLEELKQAPIHSGLVKLEKLYNSEKYIANSIIEMQEGLLLEKVNLNLVKNYIKDTTGRDLEEPKTAYEIIMDILGDKLIIKTITWVNSQKKLELHSKKHAAKLVKVNDNRPVKKVSAKKAVAYTSELARWHKAPEIDEYGDIISRPYNWNNR